MASKIEIILQVLSDGEWHSIYELQQLTELNEPQVQKIVSFLNEYEFARIDPTMKVRANHFFQQFLAQIQQLS